MILTDEQRKRIEENKRRALEIQRQKGLAPNQRHLFNSPSTKSPIPKKSKSDGRPQLSTQPNTVQLTLFQKPNGSVNIVPSRIVPFDQPGPSNLTGNTQPISTGSKATTIMFSSSSFVHSSNKRQLSPKHQILPLIPGAHSQAPNLIKTQKTLPQTSNARQNVLSSNLNNKENANSTQKKPTATLGNEQTLTQMFKPMKVTPNYASSNTVSNSSVVTTKPSTSNNPLRGYRPKVTVDFEAISIAEARVTIKPYHDSVKNLIKFYKTAKYNDRKSEWTIGFTDCHYLVNSLKRTKDVECSVKALPLSINKIFSASNNSTQIQMSPQEMNATFSNTTIESCLLNKLFPYQRAGVAFGLQRQGRLLIADEMGLGKTLQALAIARAYSSEWPLLIVCPSSVRYSWKAQIQQFLPNITNITLVENGSDKLPNERTSDTVIITSYKLMVAKKQELEAAKIYTIIFDESHLLKEEKAQRTKVALSLAKSALRRILLSGTPALARPSELFPQISMVDPTIFPNKYEYLERYCDGKRTHFGYQAKGAEHLDELSLILKHSVMIRRLKNEVLQDLPAKTREILYLGGNKIQTQLKALKACRDSYEVAEKTGNAAATKDRLMTYFYETGSAKADCVADYVLDTYFYAEAAPVKIILFAHHSQVMDTLEIRLNVMKIGLIRIDGSTKGPDREKACNRFQNDPNVKVAILSITAAGTGITLTQANKVIFAELFWTPGIIFQAEDRAHRVGQKSTVSVLYILARKTADDVIWPQILEKITVVGDLQLNSETLNQLKNKEVIMNSMVDNQPLISNYFTVIEQ